MSALRRVLIANRAEISIRIAKAASGLGIESAAVYSAADAYSLHTRAATTALQLSGDPIGAYLDIAQLVALARENGCDCVHPGYGFLAENADFAQACADANLVFIGPTAENLALFGNKVTARGCAQALNIPVVPGTEHALESVGDAAKSAAAIGYPLMLKAAAGGGGRGMRAVFSENDLSDAFERCQSEALTAFGNGALFLERLIDGPKHIEVQILGDGVSDPIHLYERDCSIQIRNQKVIEIAPAATLDDALRATILNDAVRLAKSVNYASAGTVEFLVDPEAGQHYFIECNPRIQVEHTITEQVTGVDIVEAQFRIAAGETLSDLGFAGQDQVPAPRGFAVQARVVVTGAGTLTSYKEPSGPGVRVDANGYVGYAPAPQFDPLLAKVIATSTSHGTLRSAIERADRALVDFHIAGVANNVEQLRAVLADPSVLSGDARTSLFTHNPALLTAKVARAPNAAIGLLEQQATSLGRTSGAPLPNVNAGAPSGLTVTPGLTPVDTPMPGSVLELNMEVGMNVAAGDTLLVLSAMKMETSVTAPCSGTVAQIQTLHAGDSLVAGQVVALIKADGRVAANKPRAPGETWQPLLDEVDTLRKLALARLSPQSQEPGVVRQRNRGKLTCRARIALLLDDGSFREVGSLAGFASYDDDGNVADFTPANHVGGWGNLNARVVVVCADDFTSRGGHADGAIGQKSRYLDNLSIELRVPSIRLLDGSSGGGSVATMVPKQGADASAAKESTGAIAAGRPRVTGTGGSFLPGHLGSSMYTEQLYTVPVVNMLLGSVVGIGAAKAVLGHFSVMVRDIAQLFVAGPPVVSHAMGYDITKEDLGGWHIHCTNGSVDNLAESEEDAVTMVKRFLSYLPSSTYETPPVLAPDPTDAPDRRDEELFTIVARKRTTTFDIRRVIGLLADRDSFFEIGPLWGTDQVTGFVRFNGHTLGVIASDSRHANGGALTADGCDKLCRHLDLCDLFHIPVLNLVDNPGFAVGLEHEIKGTIRKGAQWMVAFAQVKVPIFTVLMRRSFGVAGNNYATPLARPSIRVTWPSADTGGIPPEGGIEAAYKRQLAEADDPVALRAEIYERIESARGPVGPLNRFQMEEMIDPRDTRRLVCEWVGTAYRIIGQADRLVPRALQFRP
ncbi:MAG: acetyl/propionyl-CoA carboxylase alpha subunit/acetyl-CoA carboxylase carboxyltransferase component [Gammaproteobacteria bacterium]|jgi:acetyl/propionyl-CoA carboxylase alpha subunit/acetyl-CoA carboxylase carboxyltransferase component